MKGTKEMSRFTLFPAKDYKSLSLIQVTTLTFKQLFK